MTCEASGGPCSLLSVSEPGTVGKNCENETSAANKEAAECVGSRRSAVWSRSAALFSFTGVAAAVCPVCKYTVCVCVRDCVFSLLETATTQQ